MKSSRKPGTSQQKIPVCVGPFQRWRKHGPLPLMNKWRSQAAGISRDTLKRERATGQTIPHTEPYKSDLFLGEEGSKLLACVGCPIDGGTEEGSRLGGRGPSNMQLNRATFRRRQGSSKARFLWDFLQKNWRKEFMGMLLRPSGRVLTAAVFANYKGVPDSTV